MKKIGCKGTSLVSVISAFSLLLIAIAAAYTCVLVSNKLIGRTEEIRKSTETIIEAYYLGTHNVNRSDTLTVNFNIRGSSYYTIPFSICEGTKSGSDVSVYYFE